MRHRGRVHTQRGRSATRDQSSGGTANVTHPPGPSPSSGPAPGRAPPPPTPARWHASLAHVTRTWWLPWLLPRARAARHDQVYHHTRHVNDRGVTTPAALAHPNRSAVRCQHDPTLRLCVHTSAVVVQCAARDNGHAPQVRDRTRQVATYQRLRLRFPCSRLCSPRCLLLLSGTKRHSHGREAAAPRNA